MKVNIDKRRCEVDDQVIAAATKKLNKLDAFFYDDAVADVKFSELRGIKTAEVTVRSGSMTYRAESKKGDMYAAMDDSVDAIVRQIRKNKTRLERKLKEGAFERSVAADPVPEQDDVVVRRKRFAMKPMSEEEAALKMELLNHNFYMFRNTDADDRVCVVYKREAGGYGVIESE
ncbi:MAG: ribosome-associated translation inhibitor RaiA [Clostridia bacterium]|nr:ribosome-associated translation inhibitor RaiA [Clostridia bacterium]